MKISYKISENFFTSTPVCICYGDCIFNNFNLTRMKIGKIFFNHRMNTYEFKSFVSGLFTQDLIEILDIIKELEKNNELK